MTTARRRQICLDRTSYYHCISRCVRRSYLCGIDCLTNKNHDHRRGWIEERLFLLCDTFCISIVGYAVMSNHYHLILRVNRAHADSLSDDAVIQRWRRLYKGPEIIQRYLNGESFSDEEALIFRKSVRQLRENLINISRFMGNLNENIARRANKEDECKGRFWESRFKLQAILDLPALLRTMCYVDLNPVRAKMTNIPEKSQYTSVNHRLKANNQKLLPFARQNTNLAIDINTPASANALPITFRDYLELLDWTGRELRLSKRGSITTKEPPIMARLGYTPQQWMKTQLPRVSWMQRAVGHAEAIKEYAIAIGQHWIWRVI